MFNIPHSFIIPASPDGRGGAVRLRKRPLQIAGRLHIMDETKRKRQVFPMKSYLDMTAAEREAEYAAAAEKYAPEGQRQGPGHVPGQA